MVYVLPSQYDAVCIRLGHRLKAKGDPPLHPQVHVHVCIQMYSVHVHVLCTVHVIL